MTAISDKYASLGGQGGFLGAATTSELVTPDGSGRYRHYQNGSIYWSPASGAHEIHGLIRSKWANMGWERSFLGYPLTDEFGTPDGIGRYNHFQGGSIYWTQNTGAFEVHGRIRDKWATMGWERSFLSYPLTDETATPDGRGRYNHFQGGSIYWTPQTGALEVHGNIRNKWASLGWERSLLGYPVTDETATPDGRGRYNHFEGGSIYWTPQTAAHEVHGLIRNKWASMGWERSFLGYPFTDETTTPDGVGRYNHFEGGSIYWHPATGAFEVHGFIRDAWASIGWERSPLGYPTSDELATPANGGRISHFQHGSIYWSTATGTRILRRGVRIHYKILTAPTISTDRMLDAMLQIYATAGIRVVFSTTENLNFPLLNDVDVGTCSGTPTTEQTQLFANRNNAGANDLVIYFVRSTVPAFNGCATFPAGRPGAAVAQGASVWTMAHECGHVLGLNHVDDPAPPNPAAPPALLDRLMTGRGTANITNPPPDLINTEINTMNASPFTYAL